MIIGKYTYRFKLSARTCNGHIQSAELNYCSMIRVHMCNLVCQDDPSVCNNFQENENCSLNSSSNSEYILFVYDSAAVFNMGKFGMQVTGVFRRELKSASNSFSRRLAKTLSHSARSSEIPSLHRNLFLNTLFIPSLL